MFESIPLPHPLRDERGLSVAVYDNQKGRPPCSSGGEAWSLTDRRALPSRTTEPTVKRDSLALQCLISKLGGVFKPSSDIGCHPAQKKLKYMEVVMANKKRISKSRKKAKGKDESQVNFIVLSLPNFWDLDRDTQRVIEREMVERGIHPFMRMFEIEIARQVREGLN